MTSTDSRSLAERIRDRQTAIGVLVKMPNPALVELAGWLGFDLVVIDTEHGNASPEDLEHHLRAAHAARIPVLVRVSGLGPEILRALDAGAEGVIVPHVNSAGDAANVVAAAHYPPVGQRGLAVSTRAGHQGTVDIEQHIANARRRTFVMAQIEHAKAVAHTAEIAATPHLDAVWVGSSDLSMSLGLPGQFDHPQVIAAVNDIIQAVNHTDKAALCVIVDDPHDAEQWAARGATLLLYTAHTVLGTALKRLLQETRVSVGGAPLPPSGSPAEAATAEVGTAEQR